MPTDRPLPRYSSHKVVRAAKITGFRPNGIAEAPDILFGEIGAITTMLPDWHAKHSPQVGGYIVVYENGYTSYSPAEAFEKGYTAVEGPRVIDPAHRYRIGGAQVLQFLKKEQRDGEFVLTAAGTTNEELIDVLLDRLRYLDHFVPCRENSLAITKLEEAKHWLDARTRNRQAQGVEGTASMHV